MYGLWLNRETPGPVISALLQAGRAPEGPGALPVTSEPHLHTMTLHDPAFRKDSQRL